MPDCPNCTRLIAERDSLAERLRLIGILVRQAREQYPNRAAVAALCNQLEAALTPPSAPASARKPCGCLDSQECDQCAPPSAPVCNVCGDYLSEGECRRIDCVAFCRKPSAPAAHEKCECEFRNDHSRMMSIDENGICQRCGKPATQEDRT